MLDSHYSTIAVVNMFGGLIGLIPKSFVIVLIENHWWYENDAEKEDRTGLNSHFKTERKRTASEPDDKQMPELLMQINGAEVQA